MMKKYTEKQLQLLVEELRAYPTETAWLEFKADNHDPDRIGKYISALANSACIAGRDHGYLVWGIHDETHEIVGTTFNPETKRNGSQPLLFWLKNTLKPEIHFEFYSLQINKKTVVLLEIEAAFRQPIRHDKTEYVRVNSSITELSKHPLLTAQIYKSVGKDWSAETPIGICCDDLDPEALIFAKKQFSEKHKSDSFYNEIPEWDDITFLNKAKLAIDGKITRGAILLLGKPESVHRIAPSVAKITWNLLQEDGESIDYQHFEPPFLLAVDKIFDKIRNVTLRALPDGTLFPIEISQYDPWVFREALHNCIAHQDYTLCRSIVVCEYPSKIQFANAGVFIPGTVERVLHNNGRPRYYPNRQLADAMVELKMIDTIGSGIHRMFSTQRRRCMPMPEFDTSNNEVKVSLIGKIINQRYSLLLMHQSDLLLDDVILLDRLQKGVSIDKEDVDRLRKRKLIEGRYPKVYPALGVAEKTQKVEAYLDAKGYNDDFYIQRVLEFVCLKGAATRSEISDLLSKHLSTILNDEQKEKKIGNLLSVKMVTRKQYITNSGTRSTPSWVLTSKGILACKKANPSCKKGCKNEQP